jgi:hypothetical protein
MLRRENRKRDFVGIINVDCDGRRVVYKGAEPEKV